MKKVYCISGLGADRRAFINLNIRNVELCYLDWYVPNKYETIENYANNLIKCIDEKEPTLIGLSFGGIIALEISKLIKCRKVILVSSVKNRKEIPFYLSIFKIVPFYRLMPEKILLLPNIFIYWLFGINQKSERMIFNSMLKSSDYNFILWALDSILKWDHLEEINCDVVQLHGDNDRIFPYFLTKNAVRIKDGGHFMIMNKSNELSYWIEKIIFTQ